MHSWLCLKLGYDADLGLTDTPDWIDTEGIFPDSNLEVGSNVVRTYQTGPAYSICDLGHICELGKLLTG